LWLAAWLRKAEGALTRIKDNGARVRALVAIAPLSDDPPTKLSEALEIAREIEEDDERANTLYFLSPRLAGVERLSAVEAMLRSCLGTRVEMTFSGTVLREGLDRAFLLHRIAGVAGVLDAVGCEKAAEETARAVRETIAAWP